jgi:hypothetical protein
MQYYIDGGVCRFPKLMPFPQPWPGKMGNQLRVVVLVPYALLDLPLADNETMKRKERVLILVCLIEVMMIASLCHHLTHALVHTTVHVRQVMPRLYPHLISCPLDAYSPIQTGVPDRKGYTKSVRDRLTCAMAQAQ